MNKLNELKQCKSCLQNLDLNNFYNGHHRCKKCVRNKIPTPYQIEDEELNLRNLRRCNKCEKIKDRKSFCNPEHNKYKRIYRKCKECRAKQKVEYGRKLDIIQRRKKYWKNLPQEYKMLKNVRKTAIDKNLNFNLEISDIKIPTHCPILGIELKPSDNGSHNYNSPSVDRVDNTKGYVKGNIQVISYRANQIKNTGTAQEHLAIVDYILSHFPLDNSGPIDYVI